LLPFHKPPTTVSSSSLPSAPPYSSLSLNFYPSADSSTPYIVCTAAKPSGFELSDDDMNPPSPISLIHAQVLDQIDMHFPRQAENEPSIRATISDGFVLGDARSTISSIIDPSWSHPSPVAHPTLSSRPPSSAASNREALPDTIHIEPISKARTSVDASISQGSHIPFPRTLTPLTSSLERPHSWTSLGMPKMNRAWEPIHMNVPHNAPMDV
jgi:hypothetical protein